MKKNKLLKFSEFKQLNESKKFKTIKVDKNGFGIYSLFDPKSTNKDLYSDPRSDKSDFLDELGIKLNIGDVITIHDKSKYSDPFQSWSVYKIKIYKIDNEYYYGEFI